MNEKPQPACWLNRNAVGMALASFFSDLVTLIPGMLAALAFWRSCLYCWSSMESVARLTPEKVTARLTLQHNADRAQLSSPAFRVIMQSMQEIIR